MVNSLLMKTLLYLFPVLLFFSCANNDAAVSCVFSPVLETFEVTNISSSSAILRGRISFNAENCNIPPGAQQGFVYSTSSLPSIEDNLIAVYGTDININLDNLEPNTTYYVRTFIANSLGEYYGNELLFVTSNAINYGMFLHLGEDPDLSIRLKAMGYKLCLIPRRFPIVTSKNMM